MATILLVGTDPALLEGLAQTLAAVGHEPLHAGSLGEATEVAAAHPPVVAVVERALALAGADVVRLPRAQGGALILYRTGPEPAAPLPPTLLRTVLADLSLPLERHRLTTLVQYVIERARVTGRDSHDSPEPHPRYT